MSTWGSRTRPRRTAIATVALALVLGTGLAACGGDDDDGGAASDTTAGNGADSGDGGEGSGGEGGVTIDGFAFATTPVAAGSEVAVTNADGANHTVTADDGAFDTAVDANGEATFTAPSEPGTYAFHCEIHTSMTGELVVE